MPTRSIIVTDLTRFKNGQTVCIAGTDTVSRLCVRPMPYLEVAICEELQILPGAILTGIFTPAHNLIGPHQEDANYENLQFDGPCTSNQFKDALGADLFNSIEEGFELAARIDNAVLKFANGSVAVNELLGIVIDKTRRWTREAILDGFQSIITEWKITPTQLLYDYKAGKTKLPIETYKNISQLVGAVGQ